MLNRDFKEFAESLNARGVEHLVAGGCALAAHGLPRNHAAATRLSGRLKDSSGPDSLGETPLPRSGGGTAAT